MNNTLPLKRNQGNLVHARFVEENTAADRYDVMAKTDLMTGKTLPGEILHTRPTVSDYVIDNKL